MESGVAFGCRRSALYISETVLGMKVIAIADHRAV